MPLASPAVTFIPRFNAPPRLLVSVRSATEARAALEGGCDILDVKEPSRGPLGMADLKVIHEIGHVARSMAPTVSLSVALGEARDWPEGCDFPELPEPVHIVKAGVAGISRNLLNRRLAGLQDACRVANPSHARPIQWVLATYADATEAGSPTLATLFDLASKLGFWGVLIDTWNKSGPALPNQLDECELRTLADLAGHHQLQFALAGRLRLDDIALLRRIAPEIVGIRSAGCMAGDRTGEIVSSRVREFGDTLRAPKPTATETT